ELGTEDVTDFVAREFRRPFVLSNDLPIRVVIGHVENESSVVIMCAHHSAVDWWSASLMLSAVAAMYGGLPTTRRFLAGSYTRDSQALRAAVGSSWGSDVLAHWRRTLGEADDAVIARKRSHRDARHEFFELDWEKTRHLRSLARRSHVSSFVVLLGIL